LTFADDWLRSFFSHTLLLVLIEVLALVDGKSMVPSLFGAWFQKGEKLVFVAEAFVLGKFIYLFMYEMWFVIFMLLNNLWLVMAMGMEQL
jgi:hypothetical protein